MYGQITKFINYYLFSKIKVTCKECYCKYNIPIDQFKVNKKNFCSINCCLNNDSKENQNNDRKEKQDNKQKNT